MCVGVGMVVWKIARHNPQTKLPSVLVVDTTPFKCIIYSSIRLLLNCFQLPGGSDKPYQSNHHYTRLTTELTSSKIVRKYNNKS